MQTTSLCLISVALYALGAWTGFAKGWTAHRVWHTQLVDYWSKARSTPPDHNLTRWWK